jgi:hypothetical protein
MSPRFLNFVYLKCQLELDTCHHLNATHVLSDVGYYCVYHVAYIMTLKLRPSGEITCSEPFSVEVVNAEVQSLLVI